MPINLNGIDNLMNPSTHKAGVRALKDYLLQLYLKVKGISGTGNLVAQTAPTITEPRLEGSLNIGGDTSAWRIVRDGANLDFDRKVSGAWVTEFTLSGDVDVHDSAISNVNCIDFNLSDTSDTSEGRLKWDGDAGVLSVGLPGGNVNLPIGEKLVEKCKNETGATIANGSVVYINGAYGQSPTIALADADDYAKSYVFGVATESIATWGYVCTSGIVHGINTSGMAAGSVLWLSQTAGGFTTAKPDAPAISVLIGIVLYEHASEGVIIIRPTYVPRLQALSDVYGTPTLEGHYPAWSAANSRFEFVTPASVSGYEPTLGNPTGDGYLLSSTAAGLRSWVDPASISAGSGGGASITIDTFANQPASPSENEIFLPTDSIYGQVYDGSAWRTWGPIWRMVPLVLGDFTWVNQGTATATATGGALYFCAPKGTSNIRGLVKSKSGNFTLTVGFTPHFQNTNSASGGILLRESSSGKCIAGYVGHSGSYGVAKWTNETTHYANYSISSGVYNSFNHANRCPIVWLRVVDDGTNRAFYFSYNGLNWELLHTVGRTDFCNPDQIGVYIDCNNRTYNAYATFLHWEET